MGVQRKDDQHNDDLVREIGDSFNAAMRSRRTDDDADSDHEGGSEESGHRLVITGDQRTSTRGRGRS